MDVNKDLYNFLKDDIKVRHFGTKGKYKVDLLKQGESKDNVKELINSIICAEPDLFNKFPNWLNYRNTVEVWDIDRARADLETAIIKVLKDKTNSRDKNITNNIQRSGFEQTIQRLSSPNMFQFNNIDGCILSGLKYCKDNDSIYVQQNGKLRFIGTFTSLKKDPNQNFLVQVLRTNIGNMLGALEPKSLTDYLNVQIKTLSSLKKTLINQLQLKRDENIPWKDISIQVSENEYFIPSKLIAEYDGCDEAAIDNYCIQVYEQIMPGTLLAAKLIELNSVSSKIPIEEEKFYKVWNKFSLVNTSLGQAVNEEKYLKIVFNYFTSEITDDPKFVINSIPRTYTDDPKKIPGLYNYSLKLFKESLPENYYTKVEDCRNLMLLKSWMTPDEYKLTMAWIHTILHPITAPSNIALLLQTGGGTGKSSLVEIIKETLKMLTGTKDSEIYFQIKGSHFNEDKKHWIPDGEAGIPKAAFINIDEADTETIEKYKDFSGSAGGNRLQIRGLYEKSVTHLVHGKFMFTTNKDLKLTSDDGSLQRRIFIIKHMETSNQIGTKEILSQEQIIMEFKKQALMLLKEADNCYQEVIKEFDSIDEFAINCKDTQENLKESTSTSINEEIYSQIFNYVEAFRKDNPKGAIWCEHEWSECAGFAVKINSLRDIYNHICDEAGYDAKYYRNFLKWVEEKRDLFVNKNIRTRRRVRGIFKRISNTEEWEVSADAPSSFPKLCLVLYPLKNDPIIDIEEDTIEVTEKIPQVPYSQPLPIKLEPYKEGEKITGRYEDLMEDIKLMIGE